MTLAIFKVNSCVTSKVPIKKKSPCDELVAGTLLLYIVNKHQCNMFTVCSFFNIFFFTVIGNNNTMYSKNRIGNRKFHSKLPIIVFQINSISLIQSEGFRETSNVGPLMPLFWTIFEISFSLQKSVFSVYPRVSHWKSMRKSLL